MSGYVKRALCVAMPLALLLLYAQAHWAMRAGAKGAAQNPAPPVMTAEQKYKNIQVFKGLPASELQPAMQFMASSLGVNCNHCHVGGGAFEKDDKKPKQVARQMIQMTRAINEANFGGRMAVTCNTCHGGTTRPSAVPSLYLNAPPKPAAAAATPEPPPPSVEQVLDKYVEAIGGKAALEKLSTRVVKGSRVNADGSVVPTEVYQKAPDKVFIAVTYPNISYYTAFNGADAWARDSRGSGEITKELSVIARRDSEFFYGTRPGLAAGAKLDGRQKVGEQEAYVVSATSPEGGTESLFFDTKTGLLLRRRVEVQTALGSFPIQIDYEDYRQVDGVMIPFTIRWARPGTQWSRKITEVKHNVPIDDAKFNRPPAQPSQR
jgi:hypothetical protein